MMALCCPWLFLVLVSVAIVLLLRKRYVVAGIVFVVALLLNWWSECFSVGAFVKKSPDKHYLKVMSWNIDGSGYDSLKIYRIAEIIKKERPDVVFLAEDYRESAVLMNDLLTEIYPYSTYEQKLLSFGHFFYSKWPISDSERLKAKEEENYLRVRCVMNMDDRQICFYGCHLASNNYGTNHTAFHINDVRDCLDAFEYIKNMHIASAKRVQEVEVVIADAKHFCHIPMIIMGDLNDVAGSAPLKKLSAAGFHDAWWQGGLGLGATIHKPWPFRIDHILYSNSICIHSINVVRANGLSDHDGLVAELIFK